MIAVFLAVPRASNNQFPYEVAMIQAQEAEDSIFQAGTTYYELKNSINESISDRKFK